MASSVLEYEAVRELVRESDDVKDRVALLKSELSLAEGIWDAEDVIDACRVEDSDNVFVLEAVSEKDRLSVMLESCDTLPVLLLLCDHSLLGETEFDVVTETENVIEWDSDKALDMVWLSVAETELETVLDTDREDETEPDRSAVRLALSEALCSWVREGEREGVAVTERDTRSLPEKVTEASIDGESVLVSESDRTAESDRDTDFSLLTEGDNEPLLDLDSDGSKDSVSEYVGVSVCVPADDVLVNVAVSCPVSVPGVAVKEFVREMSVECEVVGLDVFESVKVTVTDPVPECVGAGPVTDSVTVIVGGDLVPLKLIVTSCVAVSVTVLEGVGMRLRLRVSDCDSVKLQDEVSVLVRVPSLDQETVF